jgi:flagellar hook-associated protein 3 FlgL
MAARIGDLAQSQRLTAGLSAIQSRLREAQVAVASGKAATRYDQIADRAGELVRVKDARALTVTLADQNERLGQRLQLIDGALGSVADVAARARTALLQRLDGGMGSDVPLDVLVDTMLAEIQSALNTRQDGQYLFAGSRSDAAPVALPATPATTVDPALYYRGDAVRLTTRADAGLELAYGVTADAAPFAELIAMLGQARAAHLADDRAGLTAAMGGLETALDGVTGLRAGVGIVAERLEAVTESQRTAVLYLDEIVAGIEDTDLAAVLTRLASDQASLEAGYSVTGKLASLSLADYLR